MVDGRTTGNTCLNWGKPNGRYSAEGYTLYNCQWPDPTGKMFPAALYHQCWLGNWEGEDARSCWIHEDLADFDTESAAVQQYLIGAYNKYIDMGVDGFRVDTAVHIPRTTWNRRFLPAIQERVTQRFGAQKARDFFVFGEVAAFVNDKWNRGSANHSAQFYTWKERREYAADDTAAALEMYAHEQALGPAGQPTSANAFLDGSTYRTPDRSRFSGMHIIDMRMHMNFGDASNAFHNGKDSDDSVNDATYNVVYVDSHDYGPNKSKERYTGGTDAWAENMSLMWTFRGIPTLYYGSETEFQAGKQIDCGPTCPLAGTGRAYYGDRIAGRSPPATSRRSPAPTVPWPPRSSNPWWRMCSASTRSAGPCPPSRWASTPPRASAATWPSNGATPTPPRASTATPWSPSAAAPPSPASSTAPTRKPSPAGPSPSPTAPSPPRPPARETSGSTSSTWAAPTPHPARSARTGRT